MNLARRTGQLANGKNVSFTGWKVSKEKYLTELFKQSSSPRQSIGQKYTLTLKRSQVSLVFTH